MPMLLRILAVTLGVLAAGAGTLVGGFHLSKALFSTWPGDYHATFAIALMSVLLIVTAGIAAVRGHR